MPVKQAANITVIGAGVIGLTTAIVLQDRGHRVTIVTSALPLGLDTTSNKAAAIWFPYRADPPEQINYWSRQSYDRFVQLSQSSVTGVRMVESVNLLNDLNPWWLPAFPEGAVREASATELPEGYERGLMAVVPFIETPVYLQYLLDRFRENGGQLNIQQVDADALATLAGSQLVVNCTGLGAAALCDDTQLYPIQGYIAKVEAPQQQTFLLRDDEPLAYILPRQDGVILGGTAIEGADSTTPDPNVVQSIIARCQRLSPNLKSARLLDAYVGLRPARKGGIRLERDGAANVIHNYGH
ncbi:MAG: FAD-dependent oxidoreductase, partial [Bacteroidota bacterium]